MSLLQGEVQYHKMKKEHSIHAVRGEPHAWNVSFNPSNNWRNLINILKVDEQSRNDADKSASKFLKPITAYKKCK
eukprot:10438798-Ditylum_brightwellii.AAC.1